MFRIKYNSPIILTFSILCTIVYLGNLLTNGAFVPYFSISGNFDFHNIIEYFRLISYVLGHDFTSMDHLLGNLTFILLLGPIVEEKYGSKNTFIMIIFTAIITAILNIILFNTGIVGASGIVFMLIILVSFTNVQKGEIPLTFILILLLFVGKEIINGLKPDNISQFGHIIGGVVGSLFGFSGIVKKQEPLDY